MVEAKRQKASRPRTTSKRASPSSIDSKLAALRIELLEAIAGLWKEVHDLKAIAGGGPDPISIEQTICDSSGQFISTGHGQPVADVMITDGPRPSPPVHEDNRGSVGGFKIGHVKGPGPWTITVVLSNGATRRYTLKGKGG